MQITVTVTPEMIEMGLRAIGNRCPVALALQAVLKGFLAHERDLWTDNKSAYFKATNGRWIVIFLPEAARDFIGKFDMGDPVEPFAFPIDVPDSLAIAAYFKAQAKESLEPVF